MTHCPHIKISLGQQSTKALLLHPCLVIMCKTEKDAEVYLNAEHRHPYCNSHFLPLNQDGVIVQDLLVCAALCWLGSFKEGSHFLSYSEV